MAEDRPGYTDTPYLPNSAYRVHDVERPHPPTVDPNGIVTKGPPEDATVLFDGGDLDGWEHGDGSEPRWELEDDYVEVRPDTGDVQTTETFGDCQLHLEWAAPTEISDDGQGRGNSGVFLMGQYEIQVLDNYDNPTYADGFAGSIYGQAPPLVNPCRPPGEWQSFDVTWHRPRFDSVDVVEPARVTVLYNGVVVQDATELIGRTTNLEVGEYEPHPAEGSIRLQDHGDRVRFRNVWCRSLE